MNMGKGLFDIAPDPARLADVKREMHHTSAETVQRAKDSDKVEELKHSIAMQIEQGREPLYILHTALRVIGLLDDDPAWDAAQRDALETIYKGSEQQALTYSADALAEEKRREQMRKHCEKIIKQAEGMKAQLDNMITGYDLARIGAQVALDALDGKVVLHEHGKFSRTSGNPVCSEDPPGGRTKLS